MYSNDQNMSKDHRQQINNELVDKKPNLNLFSTPILNSTTRKRLSTTINSFEQRIGNHQTNDLVLELKWDERNLINLHLNQLSAFLFTQNTPEIKQALCKANNEILILLSNLSLSNLNSRAIKFTDNGQKRKRSSKVNDLKPFEPTLEFDWQLRIKLIDHLILNKNLTILKSDSINSEIKTQLLNDNNMWIQILQTLPIGVIIDDETNETTNNQSVFDQTTANVWNQILSNLNEKLITNMKQEYDCVFNSNNDKSNVSNSFDKQSNELNRSINRNASISRESSNCDQMDIKNSTLNRTLKDQSIDSQLNSSTNENIPNEQINNLLNKPDDVEFTVKITNFDYFLKTNKRIHSQLFFCKSLPFQMSLKNKELKQTNKTYYYMDFNLHCQCNIAKPWKEEFYFELRCLSQTEGVPNIVKKFNYTFSPSNHTYQSLNYFSYNLILENLRKNYIVDNTIYFQVYCRSKK